jgi:hypothetical protein
MLLGGMGGMPYILVAQQEDGRLSIASNMDTDGIKLMSQEVTEGAESGDLKEDESKAITTPAASGVVQ